MKSQFLRVAQQLLEKHRRPMSPTELVNLAYKEHLFSDKLAGKTPDRTMNSKLSVHIRHHGEQSPFVQTRRGRFYLRHLLNGTHKIYEPPRFNPVPSQEHVLVFPSSWLDKQGRFQGINRNWKVLTKKLFESSVCSYMDRLQAEQEDNYKQLLTYIMVTRHNQILAFKRGTFNRVEDYLRGAHCIGFGGHVSDLDKSLFNVDDLGLIDNAVRELSEELRLPTEDKIRLQRLEGLRVVGLLNDDSSLVGRRHFAYILRYEVTDSPKWDKPERGEKSITQLRWLDFKSSSFPMREFEYWSQLCLREYFSGLVQAQPSFIIRRKKPLTPPHLLCVIGGIGSGKSEATRVLKEEFGYTEINSGKVLANILGIPPVPETEREVFQRAAWLFIKSVDGPMKLATAIAEQVLTESSARILIDGIRQRSTLDALKRLLIGRRVGLLFVHTPPDIAYQFYKERSGSNFTIHDFLRVCDSPVEGEVRSMIGISDAVLYNWTGRLLYHNTVCELIEELGIEDPDWEANSWMAGMM